MRRIRICLIGLIGAGVIFVALAGCSVNHTIKSSDIPPLQTGSPLKSVSARIFAFKGFKDTRSGDSYVVFNTRDGDIVTMIRLDQPAATVAAMMIRRELERNGHKCVRNSKEAAADFTVEGTVYKFRLTRDRSAFTQELTGNVAVKLTISSVSDDKRVLIKKYEGVYNLSGWVRGSEEIEPAKEYEVILTRAMLGMLKELSNDLEFIDFIGKTHVPS